MQFLNFGETIDMRLMRALWLYAVSNEVQQVDHWIDMHLKMSELGSSCGQSHQNE
jgi:hypothetical protein